MCIQFPGFLSEADQCAILSLTFSSSWTAGLETYVIQFSASQLILDDSTSDELVNSLGYPLSPINFRNWWLQVMVKLNFGRAQM